MSPKPEMNFNYKYATRNEAADRLGYLSSMFDMIFQYGYFKWRITFRQAVQLGITFARESNGQELWQCIISKWSKDHFLDGQMTFRKALICIGPFGITLAESRASKNSRFLPLPHPQPSTDKFLSFK